MRGGTIEQTPAPSRADVNPIQSFAHQSAPATVATSSAPAAALPRGVDDIRSELSRNTARHPAPKSSAKSSASCSARKPPGPRSVCSARASAACGCSRFFHAKTRMRKLVQNGRITRPTSTERHLTPVRAIANAHGSEMPIESAVATTESQIVRQTIEG